MRVTKSFLTLNDAIFCFSVMGKFSILLLLALTISFINTKSHKRGIAYNLKSVGDMSALSPGVSWWYNWDLFRNGGIPNNYRSRFNMEYIPMLWNEIFDEDEAVNVINSLGVKYFMVLNEPNLINQANRAPDHAARIWPRFESVAARTGAKIVGPQLTWGTMPHFEDPRVWMDNFIAAYRYTGQ